MNTLDDSIKKKIDYVIEFIGDSTDDWLLVKQQIVRSVANSIRVLFSKRHYITLKQIPNEFDKMVMQYWEERTGVQLKIPESKLQDPNYVPGEFGWKIREINEAAHRRRLEREALIPKPKRKRGRPRKNEK